MGPGQFPSVPGPGLAPRELCSQACGGGKGIAVRAQSWPGVQSPAPHIWAQQAGSSLVSDCGHCVNLQELWAQPGSALQGLAPARFAFLSRVLPVALA